jgi:hypothetical protein
MRGNAFTVFVVYVVLRGRNTQSTWRTEKNLEQGLMEKSMLAKHVYEKGHCMRCKKAKVVQTKTS